VERVLEQLVRGSHLDHLPKVHDRNPVADVVYHPQVMGDEKIREPKLLLKPLQEVDDLSLHRHVQRRKGFVGHHKPGRIASARATPMR